MEWFSKALIKYRIPIIIVFLVSAVICFFVMQKVTVNYNMADYLPENAPSTQAIAKMEDEFHQEVPNARVMVEGASIPQALQYKEQIEQVEGVTAVQWMDDVTDVNLPFEMIPEDTLNSWYQDGNALFSVTIDPAKDDVAIRGIQDIVGDKGVVSGSVVDNWYAKEQSMQEVTRIMLFVVPIVLIILLLCTQSFFEPLLFLITIGIAIVLNRGTNLIFGEISFVTEAAQSILQLAVSMDYAIVLLHRFAEFRNQGFEVRDAMSHAVKKSFSTVLSSGLTTVFGFAALILMRFKIGPDMGICMAKGLLLSLISVLVLLPALTVCCYKLIDKTQHRPMIPSFQKLGKAVYKVRVPILIFCCIILIPAFLAQGSNSFYYGAANIYSEDAKITKDNQKIQETFGQSNEMVLMVPKGDLAREQELDAALHQVPEVTSVVSYVSTVGAEIPYEFVPENALSQLESENYSLMMVSVDCPSEGDETFAVVEEIRGLAQQYYPDTYYMAGDSVSTYDIRGTFEVDQARVDTIAILAIGLIVMLTFRSISIPVILLTVIELSIWINLSIPYFMGQPLCFISFLIINAIQLGATVDYAILLTSRYFERRRTVLPRQAAMGSVADATVPILTSASILTVAGIFLGTVSTNGIISELGFLIGRGAILSTILVLFLLPILLCLLDKVMQYTTIGYRKKVFKGETQ